MVEHAGTSQETFDWLQIKKEIGSTADTENTESGQEKLWRKVKENPFVPIGALVTVGCLSFGLYSFRKGERRMSQMMMRARIVAQGFTVLALVGGITMAAMKKNPSGKS
ncbi:HIG1 domain family member 2A, mitochondrial [Rhodnius prolixus]